MMPKGIVVKIRGSAVAVNGQTLVLASDVSPGSWRQAGYEEDIWVQHPNNISAPMRSFGTLLIRGRKCVLVRSLEGAWEGCRIPRLLATNAEPPLETAIRAVTEQADINREELYLCSDIAPV